jgi:hypothetical protein
MKVSRREEKRMKVSALMRWVGPAAIAGGVFLVLSDLSGLPITIPYVSPASPSGYDAVGSGVILIALTLLLVGMAGLYARRPAPGAARVIEYGDAYQEEGDGIEQAASEEVRHETPEGQAEAPAPGSRRGGALVLGAGLVMFFLLRQ